MSFRNKLKQLGVKVSLYKRYVDDIVIIARAIEAGWVYGLKERKFIFNPDHEYMAMAPDLRTMNILKDISNQLDPNIQMTIDVPSVHSNGKLPVVDLEVFFIENKI